MTQVYKYFNPLTPAGPAWTEDLGNTTVRLGGGAESLVQYAELGQAGIGSIQIDDPAATVGHAGDAIVGLKQFYITELDETAGDQRLFTGYTADRRYSRGRVSHRTAAARLIDLTLVDENTFLSFRVFQPVALDATSSFDRPAETDTQRIAALLLVDFLSTTLYDEGFIEPAGVNMDANDYTGQRPVDVLNDCAQQSGLNFFVRFREATTHYVLHYRSNDSALDPAEADISNVLADETATVIFANQDWELAVDPSRVVAGVLLPYKAGTVYKNDLTTSYAFGYRDAYYPSSTVGTSAQATARALRYLAEGATEDERLTGTCLVASSQINAIKQGQWLSVKFSHLPGYEEWRHCRVLRRDISQQEETSAYYTVRYELTPIQVVGIQALWQRVDYDTNLNGNANGNPHAVFLVPPTEGSLLVALVFQARRATPAVGSEDTWTTEISASYGGAGYFGNPQSIACYSRVAGAGEDIYAFHFTAVGSSLTDEFYVYLMEFAAGSTISNVAKFEGDFTSYQALSTSVAGPDQLYYAIAAGRQPYFGGEYFDLNTGTELVRTTGEDATNDPPIVWIGNAEGSGTLTVAADAPLFIENGGVRPGVTVRFLITA